MNNIEGPIVLLRKGWTLFKSNWKVMVLIAILPTIVNVIGSFFNTPGNMSLSFIGGLISICGAILSIAMMPAIINTIHRLNTEPGVVISVKDQYAFGFKMFWSVLFVNIIVVLVYLGSTVLLIIPVIIVGGYASMYIYTLVIDGKKGFSALTESYALIKGRWLQVFLRLLCIGIIFCASYFILLGAAQLISFICGVPWSEVSKVGLVISSFLSLITSSIITPVALATMYNLYISLKSNPRIEVSTQSFKKWLVVFLCIGIMTPIVGLISSIVLSSLKYAREKSLLVQQAENQSSYQQEAQQIININK
ncbi:MAG: hypothetical protein WCO48_03005 [Candidatus Taylorbacteria bacterium]